MKPFGYVVSIDGRSIRVWVPSTHSGEWGYKMNRGRQTLLLLPLVAGNLLPLAQPLGGDSLLLVSYVVGDVGEGPKGLPQGYRLAGEKRGQGSTDQEDREHLPEAFGP